MANERLYQFPSKSSPVPADIIYGGDSANGFDEVNMTIAQLISAYPNLSSFAALTFGANTFAYVNNSSVFATANITSLAISLLSDSTISTMQLTLGYTATPSASLFAGWDANSNLSANNLLNGYTTTATAGATTTLTVSSAGQQFFTGSSNQTVILPVTSTLALGQTFLIVNNSSGTVTVQSSGANTIQAMAANTTLVVKCILTSGTTAASWYAQYSLQTALTLPLSLANGGTNANLTASANSLVYSGASALALLATANNGVLITSAGGVPSISSTLPSAVQTNITALGTQAQALNMGSFQINNLATPSLSTDACTKGYADTIAAGLNPINGVQAGSTTALTVTYNNGSSGVGATLTNAGAQAAFVIDGYTASLNDRILIKNQASTFQNGIYTVTTIGSGASNWVLTRATDYNTPAAINVGDLIAISQGTVNAGSIYLETATVTTIGTDPITFTAFFTSGTYLKVANNLSDLNSASTALVNLGLGTPSGTGNVIRQTSPTLITPILGAASATSLNFGASATNGIIGVTGASSAASGVVGEVLSNSTSGTSLTTTQAANATSLSLTAGDWDVWGIVSFIPGGSTTISQLVVAINTTSATVPGIGVNNSVLQYSWTFTPGLNQYLPITPCQINVSSTTTVYLVCVATFGVSTLSANGFIMARRRR